jgi:two-component system CheB/CheR fusion protein
MEESVARLREMDDVKTRFINIASHELRTPMTPIRSELHLLRSGKRGPLTPEQQRGLQMVGRNVDRLNRLIRELLEASRMQAGRLQLQVTPCDLLGVAGDAAHTMDGEAREKGVQLVVEGEPVRVLADADRITQVLINLCENAIQFTPSGGRIVVRVGREGGAGMASVADTGAGIDPAVIPKLFQPFSQAEQGVPRTEGGTGLGLYICKGFVEGHGGRIWCSSEGKGKGATFAFTLPLAPMQEDVAPASAAELAAQPSA